ncbi:MAG TPA: hypothetical protein VF116_22345 [Ktedonobacterales bacterium]
MLTLALPAMMGAAITPVPSTAPLAHAVLILSPPRCRIAQPGTRLYRTTGRDGVTLAAPRRVRE